MSSAPARNNVILESSFQAKNSEGSILSGVSSYLPLVIGTCSWSLLQSRDVEPVQTGVVEMPKKSPGNGSGRIT